MGYIERNDKGMYTILTMNRPKVNALNMELVEEIRASFRDIESEEKTRGVILTGTANVFSAGLDLVQLYGYNEEEIRAFFISFGTMYIELARFTKPFICAINGHSPAGGTVIAVTADYRIMAEGEKFRVGLNEVAVNVQITNNLINAYSFWLGRSLAYKYILEGKLLNNKEALAAKLVDEVVSQDKLMMHAESRMKHYMQADPDILVNTKSKLRKPLLDGILEGSDADLEETLKVWWSPEVRTKMQWFIAMLKAKKG